MRLHEYQSKQIFSRYNIPVPKGGIASSGNEAKQIAEELGGSVVLKSQVLIGGRGKAGGIRLAKSAEEAERLAIQLLGMEIKGLAVNKILVEHAETVESEIYLGITINRAEHKCALIASKAGGENIEMVTALSPEQIIKINIDPLIGVSSYQIRNVAAGIDMPRKYWRSFISLVQGLWRAFMDCDAKLIEVNPLVITSEQELLALDVKIELDDNALFRHINLTEMRDIESEEPNETEARKYGLAYVKLDGQVGCMSNGAGLCMAVMDLVKLNGGKPANFLDIGVNVIAEKVTIGIKLLLQDENVKVIIINIFETGFCLTESLLGIKQIIEEKNLSKPVILRIAGVDFIELEKEFCDLPVILKQSLFEAVQTAVSMVKAKPDEHSN